MTPRATDSSLELPRLIADDARASVDAAAIEDDVLALFDRFRDPLLRYVCGFGLPVAEAEDVVQEVFLALFRHLRRDGARTHLQGWLFKVAHNLALKRLARHRRDQARFVEGSSTEAALDPRRDPEAQLARRQQHTRAAAVLNALGQRDRQCISLRGSGLRYREIAQVMGMSLGAVAKSLTRSIARLQRALER